MPANKLTLAQIPINRTSFRGQARSYLFLNIQGAGLPAKNLPHLQIPINRTPIACPASDWGPIEPNLQSNKKGAARELSSHRRPFERSMLLQESYSEDSWNSTLIASVMSSPTPKLVNRSTPKSERLKSALAAKPSV